MVKTKIKQEKTLCVDDLHDTAVACYWYYSDWQNLDTYKQMQATSAYGIKKCRHRLRVDFKKAMKDGYFKSVFRNLLVYAFLQGYTKKYKHDIPRAHQSSQIEKYQLEDAGDMLGTSIDSMSSALHYFNDFFEQSDDIDYHDEESEYPFVYRQLATYNIIWNLLAWSYFSGGDYIKRFAYIRKKWLDVKYAALQALPKNEYSCQVPLRKNKDRFIEIDKGF